MDKFHGWEYFFDKHAPEYMDNIFTGNTDAEVDFLEEELGLEKGDSVLDVGCGTGRHSLELARRGYNVTGIDISEKMLDRGREIAEKENLDIEFIKANAVDFKLKKRYDSAVCLCEGAFGLLNMGEDPMERDIKILKNISSCLKPGGKFILTALNGLKKIREYNDEDVEAGRFDPVNVVEYFPAKEVIDEAPDDMFLQEKGFLATELKLMHDAAGLAVKNFWGGTAGDWNREVVKMDEMEIMVVSIKE